MKKITLTIATVLSLIITSQAFAFITVIDVQELAGKVTTIQSGGDYSLNQMNGKYLSYRGQASEAVMLFESIVLNDIPLANIDAEVNDKTGTISVSVAINGYFGFEYFFYVLKQNGN